MRARVLINAGGPWVSQVQSQVLALPSDKRVRLAKGSHIVVPRLYDHDSPYILQHTDGRVVFVIPYGGRYSLIGTTDQDYEGDPAAVETYISYLRRKLDDRDAQLIRTVRGFGYSLRTPDGDPSH